MKLKDGRISILINREYTTIELHDNEASRMFAKIELTPDQLSSALSRLSYSPCTIEVFHLDKVGKKMEYMTLEFEIPELGYFERIKAAGTIATEMCPEGWKPDLYFGSQNSFFSKDGKEYARTTIRRWVEIHEPVGLKNKDKSKGTS